MSKSEVAPRGPIEVLGCYTAIDLDRTILKSTALFYGYIIPEIKALYGFDEATIDSVLAEEQAQRGQAFDFVAYCDRLAAERGLKSVDVSQLARAIVDLQRTADGLIKDGFVESILVDGTLELMSELEGRPREWWGIMTSGGVSTQSLKYQIISMIARERIDLAFPVQIISTENKAQTIVGEWYDEALDLFRLPESVVGSVPVATKSVRLLDDKQKNLDLDPSVSPSVRQRIELNLVQVAEAEPAEGVSIRDVLQKIQQHAD